MSFSGKMKASPGAGKAPIFSASFLIKRIGSRQIPSMPSGYLKKLSPSLAGLGDARRAHVLHVVNNFHSLISGEFDGLYSILFDAIKAVTSPVAYKSKLVEVKSIYQGLSEEEKKELYSAIILHDIGYSEGKGWLHGQAGREVALRLVREAKIPVDAEKVATLVANHGLINNFGVDILPKKLFSFSENVRKQIFIMDCMDSTAKGINYKSALGIDNLNDMFEVLDLDRKFLMNHPNWPFNFRLRHLLSPATFIRLSDYDFIKLVNAIRETVASNELKMIIKMIEKQLENWSFPIFQEMFLKYGKMYELVLFLREIAFIVADMRPGDSETIIFKTQPDILKCGPDERKYALYHLCNLLNPREFMFDRNKEFILSSDKGQKIITLILKHQT